jgi:hypothetical protein
MREHNVSETDPVSETLFSNFLEYWMMDKAQKPSNSKCYTPSSEPIRIYTKEWTRHLNDEDNVKQESDMAPTGSRI